MDAQYLSDLLQWQADVAAWVKAEHDRLTGVHTNDESGGNGPPPPPPTKPK